MKDEKGNTYEFNFFAPVGQNIAHVDKLEAHFDKDMKMQMVKVDGVEVETPEVNQVPGSPATPAQAANGKVAACFEQGLLAVGKPYNKLFCLMAAMMARHMLEDKAVPAFVRMVSASYPALIQAGVTVDNYVGAINDLTQKSRYNFSNYITDQKTMIDFVKSCYPPTSTGKERKDSQLMVAKANEIFLFLKAD